MLRRASPGHHSRCLLFAIFLFVHLDSTVTSLCDPTQCRPQGPSERIVVGIVNDTTGRCTELYNNSIVLNGPNIITTQCGLRCAGRNDASPSWTMPSSSQLTTIITHNYSDLIRDSRNIFRENIEEGIYTCTLESGTYLLHIGLYYGIPESPRITSSGISLNRNTSQVIFTCTSQRSAANVTWLRNGREITIDGRGIVTEEHIRDRTTSTIDHLLKMPIVKVSNGTYTCNVSNSLGGDADDRHIFTSVRTPVDVSFNESSNRLSWTMVNNTLSYVEDIEAYIIYLPVTGYIIEITGGNCLENVTITLNLARNEFILPTSDCPDSNTESRIDNGANFMVQIKALNNYTDVGESRFTTPFLMKTKEIAPCGIPQNFTATRSGISSVVLSWNGVECHKQNGAILRYHVHRMHDGANVSKTVNVPGEFNSEVFSSLCPFLTYEFLVAAENAAGQGPNATSKVRILTETEIGASSAGVLTFLLLVFCCICGCCCLNKKCRKKRTSIRPDERSLTYHNSMEMKVINNEISEEVDLLAPEPVISIFPDNMLASPGEYVIMYVSVHGNPPLTLTWYHNNECIFSDGTIEVSEDGTLSIPSMETRHIGDYKLVATNDHGSCEAEMELYLESEDSPNLHKAMSMSLIIDSAPVPVTSLEDYVASHHTKCNDPFQYEFLSLYSESSGETTVGEMPENRALNRFKHIVPYDSNRVVLKPLSGSDDCQHDYINASYIDGHNQTNRFIATQGPLPHTVIDFWRMVWQENVPLIVMLCNTVEGHRVRCQQYWPSFGSQSYGPFTIKLEREQVLADYFLRTFKITFSGTSDGTKHVEHYQFTAWPDQLLSDNSSPILTLHKKALSNQTLDGPVLVHCSAGIGRTGSFIALDCALEQAKKEGVVDVMRIVNNLRQQRMKMVQTLAQYIDIYDSVLEHAVCGETKIDAVDLRVALKRLRTVDQNSGKTELEKQFQILQKITPSPLEVTTAKNRDALSRSTEFLCRDNKRVVLVGGSGDCLNATFVDGYRQKKAFIVTQGPLEHSCNEFWKMVYQYNCGSIVMLSDFIEYNKEVCYPYWPKASSKDYGDYNVEFINETLTESLTSREFQITCTSNESKNERAHPLTQFQILNWTPDGQCSNFLTITKLLEEVTKNQIKTGNHPIVVHCSDEVGRSAIFCAVLAVIEQCKTEVAVDVFHAVKSIRMQKPGAIVSVEQYTLIFDIVLSYLDSMDTYDNFRC